MNQKEKILTFLKNKKIAILSTVNKKALPDAAPVYFVMDEEMNFYFLSSEQTQKTENLKDNPEAVLTIVDEEHQSTIQIRARATSSEDLVMTVQKLAKNLNQDNSFVTSLPVFVYKNHAKLAFKLKPYSIRLRHYQGDHLEETMLNLPLTSDKN